MQKGYTSKTEIATNADLSKPNQLHDRDNQIDFSYREWINSQENCLDPDSQVPVFEALPANIGLINDQESQDDDLQSQSYHKQDSVIILQETKLKQVLDETTTYIGQFKQYRLSMWRLDKEKQTKLIVAEQTFTVWNPELEVIRNKFCFSIDKKLIHITFKDRQSDIIKKTITFRSQDLSQVGKFEFNYNSGHLKTANIVDDPILYMDSDGYKNFEEDDELGKERETFNYQGDQVNLSLSYFMYFQDHAKGYFCYTDISRNTEFNLTTETLDPETERPQRETIKHVLFGLSDEKDYFIVLSKVERQKQDLKSQDQEQNQKIILFKVQTINMYTFILASNSHIKEIWGGGGRGGHRYSNSHSARSTYIMIDKSKEGLTVQKAFYHKRHGIVLEINIAEELTQVPNQNNANIQSLLLISSAIIQKNLAQAEPKFFQIQNLKIPLNPAFQSKLCMKGTFKQDDYLFFFEDLVNNKGQFDVMLENKQLIKVAPTKPPLDGPALSQFNISQQFCDFIVSTEKNSNVNEVIITDVDIDTSDEFLSRPLITFITCDNMINNDSIVFQTKAFQKNATAVQQQIEGSTKQQTLVLESQSLQYNEPYIVTVENQITINIYLSINPAKNYQLHLDNHFECFLELQEPKIVLPTGISYNRHQVCMILTYDLKERCHRVQCIIMPSFNQMNTDDEIFSIVTLPYKIDLNEAPGSLKNTLITGHFLQLKEYSHHKHDGKVSQEKLIDQLVLQYFDDVIQLDLSKKPINRKVILEMDAKPFMKNHAANLKMMRTDLNGKLLKELMIKSQGLQQKDFINMSKSLLRQKFGDRRYYFVLQPGYNYGGVQSTTLIWLLEVSCQEIEFEKKVVYEFISNLGEQPSEILQMSLSQQDADGLTLLTIDRQFVVKKLKIKVKTKFIQLRQIDEALANEEAEKLWSDLLVQDQKQLMPEVSMNFKNLIPREVVLTDCGFYLDTMFFQNIFKSCTKKESIQEFELKREKDISSKLHNQPTNQYIIDLNLSGALSSPDSTSLLISFRRQKLDLKSLGIQNSRISQRPSNFNKNNRTSKLITFTNRESQNIVSSQANDYDQKVGFFFLSLPMINSKVKHILPEDTLAQNEVEFSTFLGQEQEDLLVKLKNSQSSSSNSFLIFSPSGQLRQLDINHSDHNLHSVLSSFQIKQFLSCSKNKYLSTNGPDNFDKGTNLNNNAASGFFDDHKDQTLPDLVHKILLVNDITGQYAVLNILRKWETASIPRYTLEIESDHPLYISPIHSVRPNSMREQSNTVISQIKLQMDGNGSAKLIRFIFDNKSHHQEQQASNTRSASSFILLQSQRQNEHRNRNFLYFGIDHSRQGRLENNFFYDVISKDIHENPHLYKTKQAQVQNNYISFFKKRTQNTVNLDQEQQHQPFIDDTDEPIYKPEDFDIIMLPKFKDRNYEKGYLVFKCRQRVFYAKIQKNSGQLGNEFEIQEGVKKVDVEFREPGFITQIMQVQKPYWVQIMYFERFTGNFYSTIWDLVNNQEIQMQKFKTTASNPFYQIFKGSAMRENYLIYMGSDQIQDLRLEFPQNFLSGKKSWKYFDQSLFSLVKAKTEVEKFNKNLIDHFKSYKDELKISYSCTKVLGLYSYGLTQIQRSYSYLDLLYLQYLFQRFFSPKAQKEDTRKPLIFEQLSVQLPYETNIMHFFATNSLFLELYLQEIHQNNQPSTADQIIEDHNLTFSYYALMPNSLPLVQTRGKGRRPFSIALKSNQGSCFEMMIEMLMYDPKRCYSKDMKPYLEILLVQKSHKVREFLEHGTFKQLFNQKISSHLLDHLNVGWARYFKNFITCRGQSIQKFNSSVTQYLNDDARFFMQESKKKSDDAKNNIIMVKKRKELNNQEFSQRYLDKVDIISKERVNETYSDDEKDGKVLHFIYGEKSQTSKKQLLEDKKLIKFQSFDFDGLTHGVRAENFLKFLISQKNNLGIFDLTYIQRLIEYQWQRVNRGYYIIIFVYYLKIFLMLAYIFMQQTLLNCQTEQGGDPTFGCSQTIFTRVKDEQWGKYIEYFVFLLLPLQMFIMIYEIKRYERIRGFQGIMIILFNLLHLLKLVTDQMLLLLFRVWYMRYNLQCETLGPEYWTITEPDINQSVNREYLMRASGAWIFIIKGGNAFLMISLPLIALYKLRFAPFISMYIPRFFLVLNSLLQLVIFFLFLSFSLQYSYKILSVLQFNTPSKEYHQLTIPDNLINWVGWISFGNTIYRESMSIAISAVLVAMALYGAAAFIKEEFKISKNFQAQQYIDLATLIYEGGLLLNKEKKFKGCRYVIESVIEKSNNTFVKSKSRDMAQENDSEFSNNQNLLNRSGTLSAVQNGKPSGAQNAVSLKNIRELLAQERLHNEQQLIEIKTMLQNLERRLPPQESDLFEKK